MGKNIFEPRRIVLAGVYCIDDAIDLSSAETNVYMYRLTRNEKYLRFKPGVEPVRFIVQHLKHSFATEALDTIAIESQRWKRAFLAACHLIEIPGEEPMRPEGELVAWTNGGKVAQQQWEDAVAERFGGQAIDEIGKIAWESTKLRPGADGPFV